MFIHLFNQYLLNANYVLATVGKIMNETKCLCICYNLTKRERDDKQIHTQSFTFSDDSKSYEEAE